MSEMIDAVKAAIKENLKFDGNLSPAELAAIGNELNEIARTFEMTAYWARKRAIAKIKRAEGHDGVGAQLELVCYKIYIDLPDYAKF